MSRTKVWRNNETVELSGESDQENQYLTQPQIILEDMEDNVANLWINKWIDNDIIRNDLKYIANELKVQTAISYYTDGSLQATSEQQSR